MVSTQGFNALLKLVEEPPPHLRFIFATTEPEKVLPTIRSRTHHYPFRLIPPRLLSDYLAQLCRRGGRGDRAGRPAARRTRRWRVGPRHPVRARPAHGRRRPGRRHLRPGGRTAGLHARDAPRRGRRRLRRGRRRGRLRAWSTRSSRPARTRAASPRTCCAGCATWSSSRRCRMRRRPGSSTCRRMPASGSSPRPPASAPWSSAAPPTSSRPA